MPRLTVASVIRARLLEGESNEQIVQRCRAIFPARMNIDTRYVQWYRAQQTRTQRDVATGSTGRAFGIEFEFLRSGRSIDAWATILRPVLPGLRVRGYAHSDGSAWELKVDGSCGFELVTPRCTVADWPLIERVLKTLRENGARVSRSCGLHVHHEVRDYTRSDIVALFNAWTTHQRVLASVLAPSRAYNSYCRQHDANWFGLDSTSVERVTNERGRYMMLNATTFWAHGRVEVRAHQGTLNYRKVRGWVELTQLIVEQAKSRRLGVTSRDEVRSFWARPVREQMVSMMEWLAASPRLAAQWQGRLRAA